MDARVLFVVLGEKGHIHPYIAPANLLRERGATVAFHAPVDIRATLGPLGFEQLEPPARAPAHHNRGAAFAELVRDRVRLRAWIKAMLVDGVPAQVESLHPLVSRFRPSVVVIDPMAYHGAIVASSLGTPWIALSTSLNPVVTTLPNTELGHTIRWLEPERARLFERHGIDARFRVCDVLSPHATVCLTTRALVPDAPDDVHLVGSSIASERGDGVSFPWDRVKDAPIVMSLGSQIYHQPRMFDQVRDAARSLDLTLVLAAGDLAAAYDADKTIAMPYIPQLELLERARAFITHGGANAVMEALHFGIPMIVSPICNDQHHNAAIVSKAGAGLVASNEDLGALVLERVLEDSSVRSAAARIGESYRAANGAARIADIVLGVS